MIRYIINVLGGSERIIFDTDPASPADLSVQAIFDFEIPQELQEGWGYPPIYDNDRANMFGLNLARLLDLGVPEKYSR